MAGKRKGKEDERHLWPEMLRAIKEIQPRWVVGENVYGLVNWSGGLVFHEVQTDLEAAGYEVFPYVLPAVSVNAPHRRDRIFFVAKNTFSNGCVFGQIEQERTKVWQFGNTCTGGSFGVHLSEGYAPHPNGNGLNGCDCQHEVNANKRGEYAQRNFEQMGRDVADTFSIGGNENEWRPNGKQNEHDKTCAPGTWQNFPTQPPVCSRNDGIPNRLDGITFSKWRNESIKAYGNAVVPQVVFQIFKAIEQMTNQQTQ